MSTTQHTHTLEGVRDSFKCLKESYESNNMTHCTNYVTIRLVTLIEQFCRIAYRGSMSECDWKSQTPPRIAIQILVDVFRLFNPDIEYEKCEFEIRRYGRNSKKDTDRGSIHLKTDTEVRSLVRDVLGKEDADTVEWILLYMMSLQNVKSIKDRLDVSFSREDEEALNRLFGQRNAVVHTPFDQQADRTAFDVVDTLFSVIESSVQSRSEQPR